MVMVRAIVLGASGYSGTELVKLLRSHKGVDLVPSSYASIREINGADVVFMALPGKVAERMAKRVHPKSAIIDLSPAHRFAKDYVYGLPEANAEAIKGAYRIANPGCYATACILGLLPVRYEMPNSIVFDCKSGYSGAGKNRDFPIEPSMFGYSFDDHYQKPEIMGFVPGNLKDRDVAFAPHTLQNVFNGLMATMHLSGELGDLEEMYKRFYDSNPFVEIIPGMPGLNAANGTPRCLIGIRQVDGHAIVEVVIDNLMRGAASQAVQNMNIRFGFDETEGLI